MPDLLANARPTTPWTPPACLTGQRNGELADSVLVSCGIRNFVAVPPAARAIRALVARAAQDGITLSATGVYRPLAVQVTMFRQRYSPNHIPNTSSKTWNGVQYWLIPGDAMAATPGTSNHGWGCAVDWSLGPTGTQSLDTRTITWLNIHAPGRGFRFEVASEAWHATYWLGDKTPPALAPIIAPIIVTATPPTPSSTPSRLSPGGDDMLIYTADDRGVWLLHNGKMLQFSSMDTPNNAHNVPTLGTEDTGIPAADLDRMLATWPKTVT